VMGMGARWKHLENSKLWEQILTDAY
jgi:hypothetical protein